jgi:hypothetical protein
VLTTAELVGTIERQLPRANSNCRRGYKPENNELEVNGMASARQTQAAKRNVKKAREAARRKRTIARLPKNTRSELGKQAARGRQRGGQAGRALEDRNRQQLYEVAKDKNIPGRSKMGKWDLIKAIRKAG